MTTKTKRVAVEIEAEEVVRHYRTVVLEVPDDMRDEEVECVNADHFNHVPEGSEWEIGESEGIYATGFPIFVGLAGDDAEPDVIVLRDESGEFRVRGNESS
jgi:hypothetical protein